MMTTLVFATGSYWVIVVVDGLPVSARAVNNQNLPPAYATAYSPALARTGGQLAPPGSHPVPQLVGAQ